MSRTNPAELRCVPLVAGDPDDVLLHRRERGALRRAVAISCSLLALAVAMTVAAVPSHAAVRRGGGGHFAAPHFGGGHFQGGGHFAAPHFGGGHFHGGGHFAAPHFGGGHFHGGGHFAAPHFGGGHFHGGGHFAGPHFGGGHFGGRPFHGGQFHGGQFHGRPFRGGQFRDGHFPAARMGGWHGDPRRNWHGGWQGGGWQGGGWQGGGWQGGGWQGDGWRDGWEAPGWGWGGPGFGWNGALWVGGDWGGMYWPPVNYNWNYPWYLGSIPTGAVMLSFSGVPYYYVNRVYYTWSPYYQGYVVTDPPPVSSSGTGPQASTQTYTAGGGSGVLGLRVTPKKGQSRQQTANDQYACHKWAVAQSGFNPMRSAQDSNASAHMRAGYQRAMIACLHARGYSVQGGGAGN